MKRQITLLLVLSLVLALMAPIASAAPSSDSSVYEKPTLESVDHDAYLRGTGNGCFSPMQELTRGEAAMLIYNCLSYVPTLTVTYADVPAGSWYAPGASLLGTLGIIPKNKPFNGDQKISKGELVDYIMFFFDPRTDAELFPDVWTGHQYVDAIRSARAYGFIKGDENGKFHPNGTITRAEVATLFNHVLGRSADEASVQQNRPVFYLDVPSNAWYYYDVVEASVSHDYQKSGTTETWTSFTVPDSVLPQGFTTTGFHLYNGYSYYYDAAKGDILRSTTLQNTWTFDQNGHYTCGDAELDASLRSIILAQCNENASREENLKTIFGYCRDTYTYRKRDIPATADFTHDFVDNAAKQMISAGKGNCYNFSSVFYHLSRWLGYDTTLVTGVVLSPYDYHCWTIIPENGVDYIYDTQLAWRYVRDWGYTSYLWTFYHLLDTYNNFRYIESYRLH